MNVTLENADRGKRFPVRVCVDVERITFPDGAAFVRARFVPFGVFDMSPTEAEQLAHVLLDAAKS